MFDQALPYENADTAQIASVRVMTPSALHNGIMPTTGQAVLRHRRSFSGRRFFKDIADKFGTDEKTLGSVLRVSRHSMVALLRPATRLNAIRRDGKGISAKNRV